MPGPTLVRLLGLVLVMVLLSGCSDDVTGSRSTSAGARTATPPSAPPSTTSTAPASAARSPKIRASRAPSQVHSETVTTATRRQLVGLVRIVASIGDRGQGETSTGMILSGDGKVVTNNHGVAGATAVQATVMSTGRSYSARVVAADSSRDVALLRLDGASRLAGVTLAQRDAAVGDRVTVVGDARGRRSTFRAASGTVLARDQTLLTPATATARAERLTGMMLSSCDVIVGESGGATYGEDGRVVGMTTAAVGGGRSLNGVAIPLGTLRPVVDDLQRRSAP